MKRFLRNACLLLLLNGWLIPIGFGLSFIDEWIRIEVLPAIHGDIQKPLNSFPTYRAGRQLLIFGFVWLSVAITIWVTYVLHKFTHSCKGETTL